MTKGMNATSTKTMTVDPFLRIYALRRRRRFSAALRQLVDVESLRLRLPFRREANHAWYCAGDVAYLLGQIPFAISAFRRALRSRPDDVQALWAMGNCYSDLGRARMAERCFRRALALSGDSDLRLLFNLANALLDQGKYGLALNMYREVKRRSTGPLRAAAKKNSELAEHLSGES